MCDGVSSVGKVALEMIEVKSEAQLGRRGLQF